jgi:hypothetical protein
MTIPGYTVLPYIVFISIYCELRDIPLLYLEDVSPVTRPLFDSSFKANLEAIAEILPGFAALVAGKLGIS